MTPRTTGKGSPSEDGEPFIGYIRVSTWKEEKISPELQRASIEDWARRTGNRIVEWIVDLDQTGRNFKRKIMRGIEHIESGEVKGIAVWKYSRFGRTRDGVAVNLKRVEDAAGRLESATEQVDARTATGRFQRGILFEFAAYESDVRGETWLETHNHRRYKLQLPATGRPRFGYVWHPRRLPDNKGGWTVQQERYEIHAERGPVVAELYRRYVDGEAFYRLCAWLNDHGYRTVRGGLWREPTLIRYMDSGFAAGLLRVHDPKCGCDRGRNGACPNHLYVPGAHDELISAELWQQYQERRRVVRDTPPRARTALYPLTGLARCGGCRGTVPLSSAVRKSPDGQWQTIRGYSYQCGLRGTSGGRGCEGVYAHRQHVERELLDWLRREVAPGVDAAPAVPQPRTAVSDDRVRAARERARLGAEAEKLAAGLTRLRADHAVNPDDYGPGEYEAARDRIKAQQVTTRAALERVVAVEVMPHRADYEPLVVGLIAEWPTLHDTERNAVLRQVVRRVALIRRGSGSSNVEVQIHPVWEPDPWEQPAITMAG